MVKRSTAEWLYGRLPIFAQNVICSAEGFRLRRHRYGRRFRERLQDLAHHRTLSEDHQEALAVAAVRTVLSGAERHIPYYARQFGEYGVRSADLNSLDDLRQFPILPKDVVRRDPGALRWAGYRGRTFVMQTSGSTGSPLRVVVTEDALVDEFATVWRQRLDAGIPWRALAATFNGRLVVPFRQACPPFWRVNWAMRQVLFSQHHARSEWLDAYAEVLATTPFEMWSGYPSFMALAAAGLRRTGRSPAASLRAVFSSSESLLPHYRRSLEEIGGVRVWDRYGTGELCASMTECVAGLMHVDREMGWIEIERAADDSTATTGPLLLTSFRNPVMPLIRYRVGDMGELNTTPCICGRAGPTFRAVDGRIEDFLITPDGRHVGRMDHVFKGMAHIEECQLIQIAVDQVVVRLVRGPAYAESVERQILSRLIERLGNDVHVRFEYVSQIARLPNGKFRAVVSHLGTPESLRPLGTAYER